MNEATRAELDAATNTNYFAFWQVVTDQGGQFKDIKINYLDLYQLIGEFGFYRFRVQDQPIFIHIRDHRIIKEVQISDIKNAVLDYIDNLPEDVNCPKGGLQFKSRMIKEKLIRSISTYFDKEKLDIIRPPQDIIFNQDTRTEKFLYFLNGFLRITAEKIQFLKYELLPGYIWESEVIQRIYTASQRDEEGPVKKFFQLVSAGADRYESLKIITGYLLHYYFNYKRRAVLLTDSTLDQGEANGRTGKTLYGKLVGGVMCPNPLKQGGTFVDIAGKGFDPTDKYRYSKANHDTKLIMLNDLKRNFDVDYLYNDITEGITVDKKNMQPYLIDSKMILTTNKTVKLEGASSQDRFIVFEFSDHFTPDHSPQQEFGHWFFADWKDKEFNHYYYFMALCAQAFFKTGENIPRPRAINLERRTLMDHTAPEFVEWVEESLKPAPGEWYDKKYLFTSFVDQYPDFTKLPQRKFTEWLKRYINLTPKYKTFSRDNEERDATTRRVRFLLK